MFGSWPVPVNDAIVGGMKTDNGRITGLFFGLFAIFGEMWWLLWDQFDPANTSVSIKPLPFVCGEGSGPRTRRLLNWTPGSN